MKTFVYALLLFILISCDSNEKRILNDMLNKTIRFPEAMIDINSQQLESDVKLLSFVDGNLCTECYLKTLRLWDTISPRIDSLNCSIVFVFSPADENLEDFIQLVRTECKYPSIIDINNEFIRKNQFMAYGIEYSTVLLNAEDEIQLVGNPVFNTKVWELYKKTIPIIAQAASDVADE